ncbi:MAG: hypothetical protein Q9217_003238 [Psora testacea]
MKGRSLLEALFQTLSPTAPPQRPFVCFKCQRDLVHGALATRQYHPSRRRNQSTWAQAVATAQNILNGGSKLDSRLAGVSVDPLRIVGKEMKFLTKNMRQLLGSGHPMLDTVAKYYTASEGKHIRPLLVLLMARATVPTSKSPRQCPSPTSSAIDNSISPSSVLSDINPSSPVTVPLSATSIDALYTSSKSDILPSQRRLAEITELIHTASLLHDDVIDNSMSRRSKPSANVFFGNKMAILAGDFLLGRASVALARLRDAEVIELLATVIANLVEGEFMQLKNTALDEAKPIWTEETLSYYLQKTYLKSASLISKSCRAAALLGQNTPEVVEAAYSYGRNLGLAFQLVDDMLDYTISSTDLGKPAGADLELGLATAPLLFAWKEKQALGALVGRKFAQPGDVEMAREMVQQSDGLEQTRALAQDYADKAVDAIKIFPESEAKEGLVEMCVKTMKRRK